jgi:hypothetical protein
MLSVDRSDGFMQAAKQLVANVTLSHIPERTNRTDKDGKATALRGGGHETQCAVNVAVPAVGAGDNQFHRSMPGVV